jgi:biotin carboxylase
VKPDNLGTCAHVFKARDPQHFLKQWKKVIRNNSLSDNYLIEKYVHNVEVRVFVHEDSKGSLRTNDLYVTTLKPDALRKGGILFDHLDNGLSKEVRRTICRNARRIFRLFGMKDYARIDFFVEKETNRIYFNEANTQPFIGGFNIHLMEQDGYSYASFFNSMIKRNL